MLELLEMSEKAPAMNGNRAPEKFYGQVQLKGLGQFYPGLRAPIFEILRTLRFKRVLQQS